MAIFKTGNPRLDQFNAWWEVNKHAMFEDDAMGVREIAFAAFTQGINTVNNSVQVDPMQWTGAEFIAEERKRQISDEGYSFDHDDRFVGRELVFAAVCYLLAYLGKYGEQSRFTELAASLWPTQWGWVNYKPKHHDVRNLKQAGALVAAEIDRLQRRLQETEVV